MIKYRKNAKLLLYRRNFGMQKCVKITPKLTSKSTTNTPNLGQFVKNPVLDASKNRQNRENQRKYTDFALKKTAIV